MGGGSTIFYVRKIPATTTFAYLFVHKSVKPFTYQDNLIALIQMIASIHPIE